MHRSGSTWLFNTLRIIFQQSNQSVYSYFFSEFDDSVGNNYDVHVAKTHQFDDVLSYGGYDYIFTTRRDLRDIAASAVRRGMVKNKTPTVIEFLLRTVNLEYITWLPYSDMEIIYEDMINNKEHVTARIAHHMGMTINPTLVVNAVDILKLPKMGQDHFSDTQLHHGHLTNGTPGTYRETLTTYTVRKIENIFYSWLTEHGYVLDKNVCN